MLAARVGRCGLCVTGKAGDLGPGLESLGPGGSVAGGLEAMAAGKEVVDPVVGGQKALCLAG
jgi:hypothetical protein